MLLEYVSYTVNSIKYQDIYGIFDDGSCTIIGTNVKTPNCGWKPDTGFPECGNGCENCIFTKLLLEEIGDI